MFKTQYCLPGVTLALSSILVMILYDSAQANELIKALQQRSALQSSEIELIEAQLELENWRHAQLEGLQSRGFASWLEVRRHRLIVDSITARLNAARAIQKLLSEVETERERTVDDRAVVFRKRESNPIKVFLPGSVRIIGWIEGQSLAEPTETPKVEADISGPRERLAEAQRRFDETSESQFSPPGRREKASLELNLARKELAYVKALQDFRVWSNVAAAPQSISIDEINNFVTAQHSDELKAAASSVAIAEAAAIGHIKSTEIRLNREQRRRDAFRRLRSQGHASVDELNIATDRVSKIQSQLDAYIENHQTLVEASGGLIDSEVMTSAVTYQPVSNWPAIVFNDKEFALHLIDLRREFYDEHSIADISRMTSDMLQEVANRLKATLTHAKSNSRIGSVLNEGKRNEIKAYELDIEIAKATRIAAVEKQQVLVHEEDRFIQQAIAQYDAARGETEKSNSALFGVPAMLSFVHTVGANVSRGRSKALRHCSYRESGNLNAMGQTSNLLFSQSNRDFIGSSYSNDSTARFNLQLVRSSLLTSDSRGAYSITKRPQDKPESITNLRSNLLRKPYSIPPYSLPSLSNVWSRSNCDRHDGYRSYGVHNLYPFGILRSDLRGCVTPGQLPWYLPGSPSNIRSHHVYSRNRGRNYHRR